MGRKPRSSSGPPGIEQVLHSPQRWTILRELAKGEALPVNELSVRAKCSAAMGTKHMEVLREAGLVVRGYGRLYSLAPAIVPAPGAETLDLGPCLLKLHPPV